MTSKPTQKILIALGGPEGVGKSTLANAIVGRAAIHSNFAAVAYRASFAAPLYDALAAICGVSVAYIKAHKDEVFTAETAPVPCLIGLTFRKMLQNLGEGFGRKMTHPDLWTQLALIREKVWEGKVNLIVFDDARYENEGRHAHVVYELKRGGIEYARNHPSNMGIPESIPRTVVHVDTPENTADFILNDIAARFYPTAAKGAGA